MLLPNSRPEIALLPDKDVLNIALLPVDSEINDLFYAATSPFITKNAGYCLNERNALSHATLTHFQHPNAIYAEELLRGFIGITLELTLERLYQSRYPVEGHLDAFWVGISLARQKDLIQLQNDVCQTISSQEMQPLTKMGERYHPHFTLVLLDPPAFTSTSLLLDLMQNMLGRKISCAVRLGESNQIGEFQKMVSSTVNRDALN